MNFSEYQHVWMLKHWLKAWT